MLFSELAIECSGSLASLVAPLPQHLQNIVVYNIAMMSSTEAVSSAPDGAALVRRFLAGVGHYGRSPFLIPEFGSSMVLQGFCRCVLYIIIIIVVVVILILIMSGCVQYMVVCMHYDEHQWSSRAVMAL